MAHGGGNVSPAPDEADRAPYTSVEGPDEFEPVVVGGAALRFLCFCVNVVVRLCFCNRCNVQFKVFMMVVVVVIVRDNKGQCGAAG